MPVSRRIDGDERFGNGIGLPVVARELDAELAHHARGEGLAVQLDRQLEMFEIGRASCRERV